MEMQTRLGFPYFGQNNSKQLLYMGTDWFSPSQAIIDLTARPNQTSDMQKQNCIGRVIYRQQDQIRPVSFTATFTIAVKNISGVGTVGKHKNFYGDGLVLIFVPNNKSFLRNS